MGYTIFAGCDHGSDIWQTAVQLSALRDALEEKGDGAAMQTSVVCCSSVSAPAGAPLVKVVQTAADGSACEVVAGGQADKFYSIGEIEAQLSSVAAPSAPSKGAAPPPAAEAAGAGGAALAGGRDYVIVLSGKANCDPFVAAVETAQLRARIQEASGLLPAVVHNAAAPAAVAVMVLPGGGCEGEVLCSGAGFAEVQAGLCSAGPPAAAPCAPAATAPAAAPCADPPAAAPCAEKAPSEKASPPADPGPETPTRAVPVPPPNTPAAEKTPPSAPVNEPKEAISEEPAEPLAEAPAQPPSSQKPAAAPPSSQEPAAAPPSSQEPASAEGAPGPFRWIRNLARKVFG